MKLTARDISSAKIHINNALDEMDRLECVDDTLPATVSELLKDAREALIAHIKK